MSETGKYRYYDYSKSRVLNFDQVDKLIELSIVAPKTKFDAIVKGLQLILVAIAVWTKKTMLEEQELLRKQDYQRRRSTDNQDEVDAIDL